jgi:rSAM/selenodomain-associated transferase 2
MRLSIIVPVLDEAAGIEHHLTALAPLRDRGHEVIVVDGGSRDATVTLSRPLADRVLCASRGRALQMNAGAAAAGGDVLLFLHADTALPELADEIVARGLRDTERAWGRFDVRIAGRHPLLAVVARLMNLRSRWTGIATGDQAMFVRREAFVHAGGFPAIALMEDIALSRVLGKTSRPVCLRHRVLTSGRRWEKYGVVVTILHMWRIRLAYFFGADPDRLARAYRPHES